MKIEINQIRTNMTPIRLLVIISLCFNGYRIVKNLSKVIAHKCRIDDDLNNTPNPPDIRHHLQPNIHDSFNRAIVIGIRRIAGDRISFIAKEHKIAYVVVLNLLFLHTAKSTSVFPTNAIEIRSSRANDITMDSVHGI